MHAALYILYYRPGVLPFGDKGAVAMQLVRIIVDCKEE
jgi:hypothetical protein